MGFFKKVRKIIRHPKRIIKSPIVIGTLLGGATGGLGAVVASTSIMAGTAIGSGAGALSSVANKGNSRTTAVINGQKLTVKSQIGKANVPIATMTNTRPNQQLPIRQIGNRLVKPIQQPVKSTPQTNIETIIDKMAQTITNRATIKSQGRCGESVRIAIEAGLGKPIQRTNSAKDYGSSLMKVGYTKLPNNTPVKAGDIAIFPSIVGHPHGHIQMYTKNGWVSDYKQLSYYPNRRYMKATPALYRLSK